jgi:flavin-dependent dehydrogenase
MKATIPTDQNEAYDVAVIGGGPGGAALATLLAKREHRCVILEQASFPRYHVGESLVPHTHAIFKRLGLLEKLKQSSFPVKHSVRFVSPGGQKSTPFYFSETISDEGAQTWQVERSEFDQMMLNHARENQVTVKEGVTVEKVLFENNQASGLIVQNGSKKEEISAKVIVDASGRATVIGKQLNLKTSVPGLNKASLWGYYQGGKRLPGIDAGETTLMLLPSGGWFWYIPLPDDMISVGIVAEPSSLFPHSGRTPEEIFESEISKCPPVLARLEKATRVGPVRGLERLAYFNSQTCGDGWVMIGDARAFLDPIYSSGLFLALGSAECAAECIDSALAANDVSAERLGTFEPTLGRGVETVRALIDAFYDPNFSFPNFLERFPDQRRHLIDCLVGDVLKDMTSFTAALATMTKPPTPLAESQPLAPIQDLTYSSEAY